MFDKKKEEKPDALQKRGETLPAFMKADDARGKENITAEDIQMPRLALAQKTSDEIDSSTASYIEGLKVGMMFNNVSSEILSPETEGIGPLEFTVVRVEKPKGIEFTPIDEGGGVVDLDVPLDDPRMQWQRGGEKPIATKFHEFIVLLIQSHEVMVLSFKSTGIKTATRLNFLIANRDCPSFGGKYALTSGMTQNKMGKFAVFTVRNAGLVDEETYHRAESLYDSIKGRGISLDRDEGTEKEVIDDVPF